MFIASSRFGGAEKVVVDLSNALALQGVEVVVAAFDWSVWLSRLSDDIKVHRLTSSQGRYNPRLYLQLRKIIISERPDIVHSHGAKGSEVISRVATLTPI
ncbi:MAG: glycosyltransferase family 4 protein [Amphritea sp.]